jgi:phytoene/squalene synthetase
VRFADEIVDTFYEYDRSELLAKFKADTFEAIERKLSLNPILHSFQLTVNQFSIDLGLIEAFFRSMEMDLDKNSYDRAGYWSISMGRQKW